MPLIVGFRGHSGVGKDTSVQILRQIAASAGHSTDQAAIAGKVKHIAYGLYSHLGHQHPSHYEAHREDRLLKLPLIDKTVIEIWCALGDSIRDNLYQNTWVDQAIIQANESSSEIFCLTDVRYPSEIEAIRRAGGLVVNVINPRVKPLNTKADHALDHWQGTYDHDLHNDSTVTELENRVHRLSKKLFRSAANPVFSSAS